MRTQRRYGADPYAYYDVKDMPGGYSYRVWTQSNNVTIIGGPRNVGETYGQGSGVGAAIMAEIRSLGRARDAAVPLYGAEQVDGGVSPGASLSGGQAGPFSALASVVKPLVNLIPGVQDPKLAEARLRAARLREQQATTQAELLQARQQVVAMQAQLATAQQAAGTASSGPGLLPVVLIGGALVIGAVALRGEG